MKLHYIIIHWYSEKSRDYPHACTPYFDRPIQHPFSSAELMTRNDNDR